jgi:hypothetical protein
MVIKWIYSDLKSVFWNITILWKEIQKFILRFSGVTLQGIVEFVFESPLDATKKGVYQLLEPASEININIF